MSKIGLYFTYRNDPFSGLILIFLIYSLVHYNFDLFLCTAFASAHEECDNKVSIEKKLNV